MNRGFFNIPGIKPQARVAGTARKTPIAICIGEEDPYFSIAQARQTRDSLLSNGFPVHYVELPNQDHNYAAASGNVNSDAWAYMSQFSLP